MPPRPLPIGGDVAASAGIINAAGAHGAGATDQWASARSGEAGRKQKPRPTSRGIGFDVLFRLRLRAMTGLENAMKIVWAVVAILSLLFWGFAAFDLWATLTAWPPYQQYGAEWFAWIQSFPIWRKAIWGLSIALGVIGSLMMFGRMRLAGPAMLGAFLMMAAGFAYDIAVQDGASNYGQEGLVASGVLVGLTALFAWAGYASARKASQSSKTTIEPTPARAAHAAATPAQSAGPAPASAPPVASPPKVSTSTPAAETTIAPAAKDVPPTPPDTDVSSPAAADTDEPSPTPAVEEPSASSPDLSEEAAAPTDPEPPAHAPKPSAD